MVSCSYGTVKFELNLGPKQMPGVKATWTDRRQVPSKWQIPDTA